jgi:uncharacterized protein (DUF2236 family)
VPSRVARSRRRSYLRTMKLVRDVIEGQVHRLVGFGSGEVDLDRPAGDIGLFGPGSAAWRVHADFTAMMVGGVSALLLQMLRPGALAGVWDHSNFRDDMEGRLRRTAQFISGTTYGSRGQALALIARVRFIHDRVNGILPDGTPYSANDPDLLTWIHVAEVSSFLAAHMRYRDPAFPPEEQDRYYAEIATIAHRLGTPSVPASRSEMEDYFAAIRPALRVDQRTRAVCEALLSPPSRSLVLTPFRLLTMQAGIELLPGWAAEMHGFAQPGPVRPLVRTGAKALGAMIRWSLRDGSARRAERRTAA